MLNRILHSIAFGATFAIATLFYHDYQPIGRMSIFAETFVRFLTATIVNFFVFQLFSAKKENKAYVEEL